MTEKDQIKQKAQKIFDDNIGSNQEHGYKPIAPEQVMVCILKAMNQGYQDGLHACEQLAIKTIKKATRQGVVIGLKDANEALNEFIEKKKQIIACSADSKNQRADVITQKELSTFFDTHIKLTEQSLSTTENKEGGDIAQ